MGLSAEQAWLQNWKRTGPALDERRRAELRRLTPERALFFSDAVLSLVEPEAISPARRRHSGLVEQQALFAPLRER